MGEQWWYRTQSEEHGPVDADTIRRLRSSGVLTDSDSVRRSSGPWRLLGSCGEFRTASDSPPRSELSAAIRQATVQSIEKQRRRQGRKARSETGRKQAGAASLGNQLRHWGAVLTAPLEPALFFLSTVAGFLWEYRRVAAGAILAATIVAALTVVPKYWWTEQSVLDEVTGMYDEFRKLRDAGADARQWDAFSERVRQRSDVIASRLESTAVSEHPLRQALFWAVRDHLPDMLTDARNQVSPSERKFLMHLGRATELARQDPPGGLALVDPMTAFMLLLDGVLVVGVAVAFLRRRG